MSQILMTVRASGLGLRMADTHPHLMKKRLAKVVRGICNVIPNRVLKILLANWYNLCMILSINMLVVQCTFCPKAIWPIPFHGDSDNMTQLYKEAETRDHKVKRHYALTR